MSIKPTIYLAGPMEGRSQADANGWRRAFMTCMDTKISTWYDARILSPMRGKDLDAYKLGNIKYGSKHIITRDRNDVRRADLVVMYLDAVSVGTMVELGWASAQNIPVVGIIRPEFPLPDHPFIQELIGFKVTTIEEAALAAEDILG